MKIRAALIVAFTFFCFYVNVIADGETSRLDINAYLELADSNMIYPTTAQISMLEKIIPNEAFQPAPSIDNRKYWNEIASSKSGQDYLKKALSLLNKAPEVPISDEIYRRANKEGNRAIYKPRYYRTMERLEHFVLAECIENEGRFLDQIIKYSEAIMDMKSWVHPNHDDGENGVLEGIRITIDLGARRFGSDLALVELLIKDKLPSEFRTTIETHLQRRIIDSYLHSCKTNDENNRWIKSTSNWNSVCTSGSVFTTISMSKNREDRIAAIGSALNSIKYYLSGFGQDGYCSEGAGYWNYGFEHYLYLAKILQDYTNGAVDLFNAGNPEKMENVGNYPKRYRIQSNVCAPFSDGSSTVDYDGGFAYTMSMKHYGLTMPAPRKITKRHDPFPAVFQLIRWNDGELGDKDNIDIEEPAEDLPNHTYFEDFGIVISRGKQNIPLSIAIKSGHNAENHNHSDVGSYSIVLGNEIITGDIGAPSYRAGAFDPENAARSSWGHPVPRIDSKLQSNGKAFSGEITKTVFSKDMDRVEMDISSAYELPYLKSLNRSMTNSKTNSGTIAIKDTFSSAKAVVFGTAIMTLEDYEIINANTVLIKSKTQSIMAEISAQGGKVKIIDELVPVEHLREGGPAYRIGIEFTEPLESGSISISYKPTK